MRQLAHVQACPAVRGSAVKHCQQPQQFGLSVHVTIVKSVMQQMAEQATMTISPYVAPSTFFDWCDGDA
jgi:hypothetical protein